MGVYEELQARGLIAQVTNEEEIRKMVNEGKAVFYIGFDPTADSLHVGHFMALCLMKRLQMAGNKPIALIGGGTGMVGDPSGRTDMRTMMTVETIQHNCDCFKKQMSRFIDFSEGKAMMVNNAEWLMNLNYIDFLREIGPHFSVNNMLRAECYKQRMEKGLSFLEFNYMLMQSYDFYELFQRYGCNMQFGGDDQWSNMLGGTELIRRKLGKDAHAMTITLLLNSEGKKMGKTQSGAVWLDPNKTTPFEFYQYWRNVGDADVLKCLRMLTFLPLEQIDEMDKWEGSQLNEAKEIPAVVNALGSLTNPFLAFLVGWVATAILQSNSATVGIIMLLAREGLMGLPICLFMMLGCNIGCTMSAILASFGCKKDAKRAACVHLLFNISGTIVCSIIFLLFGKQVVDFFMGISGNEAGRMIANANSIIKVCQVLLMLPFTPLLVKATYFIIRGNDEEDKKFELAYISSKHAMSPTTAVLQAVREMERMAQMAETNLIRAMNTLVTRDQKEIDEVYRVEENINFLNKEITNYLVHLNQASLPTSDVMRIGALFHVVNDIERIGDHAENVADSAVQMTNDNVTFSKQGELDLSEMLDMVLKILDESIEMFAKNDLQHLQEIIDIENSIDQEERDLQQKHVERLTRNECTPEAGMIFSDLVSGLERVADHATNIAFSILDEDPEEKAAREAVAGAEK